MKGIFKKIEASLFLPVFDWIQVEVTSICDAACFYCPRTAYGDRWQNRHMTSATFAHLVPILKHAKLIHLQGWGEPFLNPDFFFMAEHAKKAGCLVGTTTNGMNLDDATIEKIIGSNVDVLSFSLAHTDARNDHLRKGTRLSEVLKKIRALGEAKKKSDTNKPSIHVSYTLLKSNREELARLPSLLQGIGVDQVVVSTLDFVPTEDLKREELFPKTKEGYEELASFIESVRLEGERMGVQMHYQIPNGLHRRSFCSENIEKACVIAASGDVFPCVITNMPVTGLPSTERMLFGNITGESFTRIWRSKAYKQFRRSFYDNRPPIPRCLQCSKLYLTSNTEHGSLPFFSLTKR